MLARSLVAALAVFGVGSASFGVVNAQVPASVYVVHGIPGADVGLPAGAPVDVSVNGACFLPGFSFGRIEGPVSLPAGDYTVAISPANAGAPCSNPAVIGPVTVPLGAGEDATLIAHLTDTGVPTASKFRNDLSATGRGRSRVLVHHAAAAPGVDVTVSRNFRNPVAPSLTVPDFANGDQAVAPVKAGQWQVAIAPAGTAAPVFGPAGLGLHPFSAYLVYAVGSVSSGSFTLLVKEISGLK